MRPDQPSKRASTTQGSSRRAADGKLVRAPEEEVSGARKNTKSLEETIRKIVRGKGPRGEDGIYVAGEVMDRK